MATFTFTGTLLQHDGVTPYVDSSITIYAGQTPDLVGLKVYSGGGECVTDANGVFTIQLVTGASLYYAVSSDAKPPVFQPFVFAAGAASSTVNLASVISSSAGAVVPSVLTDAIAARDAAIASASAAAASAASVNRETANGVAGLDSGGKLIASRMPASPTFAGTTKVDKIGYGQGTATTRNPDVGKHSVSNTDVDTGVMTGDAVGYSRQSVWTGDFTPKGTVTISATGGTWTATIGGQTTAALAFNASVATVQSALDGLSTVGGGWLVVTGSPGAYVVAYPANKFKLFSALTVNGAGLTGGAHTATVTWVNNWGGETGFVFGRNDYHTTGTASGDGNGINRFYGSLAEADICSDAAMGTVYGFSAEASFEFATATGSAQQMYGLLVNSGKHKDGALPTAGTVQDLYGLYVNGIIPERVTTDCATTSGSAVVTSPALGLFTSIDKDHVVTGAGIPANTYILSVQSPTQVTLSNNCTATASGVSMTIKALSQASFTRTAYFGPGIIGSDGQLKIQPTWADTPAIKAYANPNITSGSAVLEQYDGGNVRRFFVDASGAVTPGRTTTAGRPSAVTLGSGATMYDTDTGRLIVSNGTVWASPAAVEFGDDLTTGEETFDRSQVASAAVGMTSGILRVVYFTARKNESISQVRLWSGATAAGATPTLIRVGIWTADENGALLTQVAATPSDTTLLAAANTQYTKSLSASFTKVRGVRYAVGLLVVTGATAPSVSGSQFGAQNAIFGQPPVKCTSMTGQTDIPSTATSGSVSAGLNRPYFVLLP